MTVLTEPGAIELPKAELPEFNPLNTAKAGLPENKIRKICFVCTGNTCRSPMAMALYNHLMSNTQSFAVSLGLYPNIGEPISKNAVTALMEYGVESAPGNRYDRHHSDIVTEERLCDCDRIIGMTEAHTLELMGRFPILAGRIMSMPHPIADPYGNDIDCYRRCLYQIEKGIKELFNLEY